MRYKTLPDKADTVVAWKLEEKQTDVNLALDIYRDIVKRRCEQIVVCSNNKTLEL